MIQEDVRICKLLNPHSAVCEVITFPGSMSMLREVHAETGSTSHSLYIEADQGDHLGS